ncbi:MAG: hypothetical protein AVO33_08900 [delta proteobacterium ML8_F1]|nr:MAG: hypothetical protein AVO33_08900 [delta proteobacterium ML8_F1]
MKAIKNENNHLLVLPELLYSRLFKMLPLLKKYHHGCQEDFFDAFHDLYLTIYENIHHLKKLEAFEKWTLVIFVHRQRPSMTYLPIEYAQCQTTDHCQSVIDKNCLLENLTSLTYLEKLILKENILEGYSLKEIAVHTSLSHGYVRLIKHRALHKLKNKIK